MAVRVQDHLPAALVKHSPENRRVSVADLCENNMITQ
jgi:hypothetical protein